MHTGIACVPTAYIAGLIIAHAPAALPLKSPHHGPALRSIRKVKPLRRQLGTLKAWITGQRKDQSPGTRMAVPAGQVDPAFEGAAGGKGSLIKYNPLTNMTSAEVWNFLRIMDVPTNKLHKCGYVSIGCEPCTRPVLPSQQEREGRWWWEDAAAKECGLHSGNVSATTGQTAAESPDLFTDRALLAAWPPMLQIRARVQRRTQSCACMCAWHGGSVALSIPMSSCLVTVYLLAAPTRLGFLSFCSTRDGRDSTLLR